MRKKERERERERRLKYSIICESKREITNVQYTLYGFEFELNDWRSKFPPWEYSIIEQSGLQLEVNIGRFAFTNVDRSIPLRDQTLINPSSPAVIKIIFFKI